MSAPQRQPSPWRSLFLPLIALMFMLATRCSTGPVLGLGFVPLFIAPVLAVYVPWRGWQAGIILLLIAFATSVPLVGLDSFSIWLQITALLVTVTFTTNLATTLLLPVPLGVRGGVSSVKSQSTSYPAFAAAGVVLLWVAWLTWPIWLASAWRPILDHLLNYNPLNLIGSLLIDLGDWTHQPIAYNHLLNLEQDVPYEPAASAWPGIGAHAAVATLLGVLVRWRYRRQSRA